MMQERPSWNFGEAITVADAMEEPGTIIVKLPYLDGTPFIAKMEKAIEAEDADFVEANMPLQRVSPLFQATCLLNASQK